MYSYPARQYVPTPKKSNKIWIMVGVVLFLGCLCSIFGVVAGYLYFQNNNTGIAKILDPIVQPAQPNKVIPAKEIRSEFGGYAFKTIPNYEASGGDNAGLYMMTPYDKDYGSPTFNVKEMPRMYLQIVNVTTGLSFEKFAQALVDQLKKSGSTISNEPQVSIAGLKGKAYEYDYEEPGVGMMKGLQAIVEVNPKRFFHFKCYSTVKKWDKTQADCNMVINSITFFEPKPK